MLDASPDRAGDRERLAAAVRGRAGRAEVFPRAAQATTRAWRFAVTDDIASNDLLHRRLMAPGRRWLSEESETIDATRSAPRLGDRSGDARLHRRPRGLVGLGGAGGRRPAGGGGALCRRQRGNVSGDRRRRRRPNDQPIRPVRATASTARVAGPKRARWRAAARGSRRCRACIRSRCGSRASPTAAVDAAVAGGNGHDGTSRPPICFCTKPGRRADVARRQAADLQPTRPGSWNQPAAPRGLVWFARTATNRPREFNSRGCKGLWRWLRLAPAKAASPPCVRR